VVLLVKIDCIVLRERERQQTTERWPAKNAARENQAGSIYCISPWVKATTPAKLCWLNCPAEEYHAREKRKTNDGAYETVRIETRKLVIT